MTKVDYKKWNRACLAFTNAGFQVGGSFVRNCLVLDIARPGRTWLSVTLADFSAETVVRAVEELTEKYDELERAHVALGAEETKVRFG